MEATVYGLPASHPVRAARLMLDHKGIPHRLVLLAPAVCKPVLRAMRFPQGTVPAIKLDGRRVQTTRAISRALDELRPDPPLFPADPELRARVEEAERWGDEVLQPIPRRIGYARPIRRGAGRELESFFDQPLAGGLSPRAAVATAPPLLALGARLNSAGDEQVRADLAALPGMLDRVDELIAQGVIAGEQLNAADFQLGATVRLLLNFEDLRPAVEGRPAAEFARRVCPEYPGHMPALLPSDWVAPLRA